MSVLNFSLDWFVDRKGYRIEGSGRSRTIVANGGALLRVNPLGNERLFAAFANVASKPDPDAELLEFIHNNGLLETRGDEIDFGKTALDPKTMRLVPGRPIIFGENVEDHLRTAALFADLMSLIAKKGRASAELSDFIQDKLLDQKLGSISWGFIPEFTMKLMATTLLNGMLMQLAQAVSAQPALRVCKFCKKPFALGPKTERRAHALFCSPNHKMQYHSRERSRK